MNFSFVLEITGIVFLILLSLILFVWISFKWKYRNIRAVTLHMQKPTNAARHSFDTSIATRELIAQEEFLRRLAYKNTSIQTGPAFFDDSDLSSDYFLVVIYERNTKTPLLSARYYFDKAVIAKYLKGDEGQSQQTSMSLDQFNDQKLFLADRFSGNISSTVYRRHRDYIFLLFYQEILARNKNAHFILMARKERCEKLLTKYLRLGLDVAGETQLRGKPHWILLGNINKSYSLAKKSVLLNVLLILNLTFKK